MPAPPRRTGPDPGPRDAETLAVYAARAGDYAELVEGEGANRHLEAFMGALAPGGRVLDWGCGPGHAAARLREAGFRVTATDASPAFADEARRRHGIRVRVETFADLRETGAFDGIWASFSLLHAPRPDMAGHLARARGALKPGGRLWLGLKLGEGEGRDALGRFYAYYSEEEIRALLAGAGFAVEGTERGEGAGLDGRVAPWIAVSAHA